MPPFAIWHWRPNLESDRLKMNQTVFKRISIIAKKKIHYYVPGDQSSAQHTAAAAAKLRQSFLTLCDPIDSSPPGSSVSGILQARALEGDAIAFSVLSIGDARLIFVEQLNKSDQWTMMPTTLLGRYPKLLRTLQWGKILYSLDVEEVSASAYLPRVPAY